jgi:hypothetical protein
MSSIRAMETRKISLHTHPFVYECKQKCCQLTRSGREVSFMWGPAHVGIAGNERADYEASQATLGNMVYTVQCTKQRMLDQWQKSWEVAETERFLHSIFPRVSLRPWFEEWRAERKLKTTVSRIISGTAEFVDGSMCVCQDDHEHVDHNNMCPRFSSQRACLIGRFLLSGVYEETPIRDLCAHLNWKDLK